MAQISETVDYTKKAFLHSSYRWIKLTPVGGSGQSATLSTTSATIVNFEIPNNVMNLSQSKLAFDMLIAASATAANATAVDALGLSLFDRITLSTRSGVVLANCDNMGQFAHLISKLKNKVLTLADNPAAQTCNQKVFGTGILTTASTTYPQSNAVNTAANSGKLKPYTDICKSNGLPLNLSTRSLNVNGANAAALGASVSTSHTSNILRFDGSFISTPLLEPLSFITQNSMAGAGLDLALSYQLPLGSIKDTLLEINKSLYFGDNLILSLSFNPATKFSWTFPASTDTIAGSITAGAAGACVITAPTSIGTSLVPYPATAADRSPSLSNLALYVAVETDPVISSQLINRVNTEGFTMTVPFVYCTKSPVTIATASGNVAPTTGSFSMQQRITRGYGQRLLRCYTAIFNTESVAAGNQCGIAGASAILPKTISGDGAMLGVAVQAFTVNQHTDTLLSSYNTSLDGVRLQDFSLSAEDSTHWLVNEPYLRGSCILNIEQYKNQTVHIDSWTGRPVCEEDDTVDNGLSLDADKTYGVSYNSLVNISTTTQYQHYLFFTVQRQLSIRGNMIGLQ
jgi:hypothetical protein